NYLSHLVRVLPLHSQSHHQQAIPSVDTDVFYGGRGATTLPPARGENRHKFNEYFHPLPASLTHTHTHTHTHRERHTHTHTQRHTHTHTHTETHTHHTPHTLTKTI